MARLGRRRRTVDGDGVDDGVGRDDDAGRRDGPGAGAQAAAGGAVVLRVLATIVDVITALVTIVIVLGILLVILNANAKNTIVKDVHDVAKFLVGPFDDLFTPKDKKLGIAVNWGIAAAVYLLVGRLIASLLRRPSRNVA